MMFTGKRIIWLGIIVALLQSGALYAMVEQRASILRHGKDVILLSEPVDPRDFLRGDYVTLSYDISTIIAGKVSGTRPTSSGLVNIYVTLAKGSDERWIFVAASWEPRTDLNPEEVQIRGNMQNYGYLAPDGTYRVSYGIERYYVPEGQGIAIEDQQRKRNIDVVIAVSDEGQAQIRSLRSDGKVLYEEPLY
ncbi:GDYXXLXY domain-containing protein [Phyllobacterium sp. YR531]|uniref:GDYXXLXY domain-containing protein n=1 Tax=Phyllobacterium sp. YR531 TaxID=1144343 RepID=UPI00026FA174|nr:GDYXXLXY domain-containing protein [Phyllobacterium sp. YR531]EJN03427.1 putative membrane-anchored protein [Phyllobacterium sp. YR531]